MGKEYEGIHRISFLIDPQGKIQKIWPKCDERTLAEVLAAIQGLASLDESLLHAAINVATKNPAE